MQLISQALIPDAKVDNESLAKEQLRDLII